MCFYSVEVSAGLQSIKMDYVDYFLAFHKMFFLSRREFFLSYLIDIVQQKLCLPRKCHKMDVSFDRLHMPP